MENRIAGSELFLHQAVNYLGFMTGTQKGSCRGEGFTSGISAENNPRHTLLDLPEVKQW
jgi:hypothetical protein